MVIKLLSVLMFILIILSILLNKKITAITAMIQDEHSKECVQHLLKKFSNSLIGLAILGLGFLYLNTKTSALFYVAIIMLTSAFFSIELAKTIETK